MFTLGRKEGNCATDWQRPISHLHVPGLPRALAIPGRKGVYFEPRAGGEVKIFGFYTNQPTKKGRVK